MNKSPFGARLGAWLCALLLTVAPVEAADYFDTFPGGTRIPAAVLMTGCVANGGCLGPVSASNPLPVSGNFTASLGGFTPSASGARMSQSQARLRFRPLRRAQSG
jgi:hypothetical protein